MLTTVCQRVVLEFTLLYIRQTLIHEPNLPMLSACTSAALHTQSSHLSNNRGGWNKRGGGAKVAKSINVEVGINVKGGIFWKKLVHNCNKRGVEGGKNLRNQ